MMLWAGFALCSGLIFLSGHRLSRYGDIIAEKTGLGRAWIGLVLMASVTSLPELITGLSSVTIVNAPDIAVGDVLGSCVFNMLILAALDALSRPVPISAKAHHGHVLAAGFGVLLISIVGAGLALGDRMPPFGWIGPPALLTVFLYLIAMRMIYFYERRQVAAYVKEKAEQDRYADITLRTAAVRYAAHALVVIAAAVLLPRIGVGIAEATGLGQSFVGNVLIAVSTSLPEVVVAIAAVRIDAVDLAIGNLFGSNIFNIFILALDDLFFTPGPLLSFAGPSHIVSALSAIAMTAVAAIGLTYRAEKKPLPVAWDSLGIMFIYIANVELLYLFR